MLLNPSVAFLLGSGDGDRELQQLYFRWRSNGQAQIKTSLLQLQDPIIRAETHLTLKQDHAQRSRTTIGTLLKILKWFRLLSRQDGVSILVTACPDAHYAACLRALISRKPMVVIRFWRAPSRIHKRWWTKLIYRRLTHLHWTCSGAVAASMEHPGDDRYEGIPTFFRLDDSRIGDDAEPLMIDDCFRGLLGLAQTQRPLVNTTIDRSHIRLTYITHFYFDQKSTDTVTQLFSRYAGYASEVLDQIHFIVVDDGSPLVCQAPDLGLNLTWLRITDDIRWNMPGARNLAAIYASSENLLFTDIDHEFPESTLRSLVAMKDLRQRVKPVSVRHPKDNRYWIHPNIFLTSRSSFYRNWGYDEEYAGAYGMEDHHFNCIRRFHGALGGQLPRSIFCLERDDIDRSKAYHGLTRHWSHNLAIDVRKRLEISYYGSSGGHSRSTLNFDWVVSHQKFRPAPLEQTKVQKRLWAATWRFRQIRNLV